MTKATRSLLIVPLLLAASLVDANVAVSLASLREDDGALDINFQGEGHRGLRTIPPEGCCSLNGNTCFPSRDRRCVQANNNRKCKRQCDSRAYFAVPPPETGRVQGCCSIDAGQTCIQTRRVRCINARNTLECRRRCPGGRLTAVFVEEQNLGTPVPPDLPGAITVKPDQNEVTTMAPPVVTTPTPDANEDCAAEIAQALTSCPTDHPVCESLLTAHNTRRCSFLTENNKPIVLMKWNTTLEDQAVAWANQLKEESGPDSCVIFHDFNLGKVGENLYGNWNSEGVRSTADEVLDKWFNEQLEAAEGGDTSTIGHFAQVAWSTTDQLGCAWFNNPAADFGPEGLCHVLVCRYFVRTCGLSAENWLADILEGDERCSQ